MCRARCDKGAVAGCDDRPGKASHHGDEVGAIDDAGGGKEGSSVQGKAVGASDARAAEGKKMKMCWSESWGWSLTLYSGQSSVSCSKRRTPR